MSGYYASAIDMNPKTGMVVVAGKETNESAQSPALFIYEIKGAKEDLTLTQKEVLKKKDVKQISAVKVCKPLSFFYSLFFLVPTKSLVGFLFLFLLFLGFYSPEPDRSGRVESKAKAPRDLPVLARILPLEHDHL